jgi:hypothetical protein
VPVRAITSSSDPNQHRAVRLGQIGPAAAGLGQRQIALALAVGVGRGQQQPQTAPADHGQRDPEQADAQEVVALRFSGFFHHRGDYIPDRSPASGWYLTVWLFSACKLC